MTTVKLSSILAVLLSILGVALYFQQKDQRREREQHAHEARVKAYQKVEGGYGHVGTPYKATP